MPDAADMMDMRGNKATELEIPMTKNSSATYDRCESQQLRRYDLG
jgi:hypothetical protein